MKKRDTNTDLMNNVLELAKNAHCYGKAGKIMDYFLPETHKIMEFSNYEFDFETNVCFGAGEGIYLDCYIKGDFDENRNSDKAPILHCGTFKTLETSLSAMRTMGGLAGSLTYFAREYINDNLDKFTSSKERCR